MFPLPNYTEHVNAGLTIVFHKLFWTPDNYIHWTGLSETVCHHPKVFYTHLILSLFKPISLCCEHKTYFKYEEEVFQLLFYSFQKHDKIKFKEGVVLASS